MATVQELQAQRDALQSSYDSTFREAQELKNSFDQTLYNQAYERYLRDGQGREYAARKAQERVTQNRKASMREVEKRLDVLSSQLKANREKLGIAREAEQSGVSYGDAASRISTTQARDEAARRHGLPPSDPDYLPTRSAPKERVITMQTSQPVYGLSSGVYTGGTGRTVLVQEGKKVETAGELFSLLKKQREITPATDAPGVPQYSRTKRLKPAIVIKSKTTGGPLTISGYTAETVAGGENVGVTITSGTLGENDNSSVGRPFLPGLGDQRLDASMAEASVFQKRYVATVKGLLEPESLGKVFISGVSSVIPGGRVLVGTATPETEQAVGSFMLGSSRVVTDFAGSVARGLEKSEGPGTPAQKFADPDVKNTLVATSLFSVHYYNLAKVTVGSLMLKGVGEDKLLTSGVVEGRSYPERLGSGFTKGVLGGLAFVEGVVPLMKESAIRSGAKYRTPESVVDMTEGMPTSSSFGELMTKFGEGQQYRTVIEKTKTGEYGIQVIPEARVETTGLKVQTSSPAPLSGTTAGGSARPGLEPPGIYVGPIGKGGSDYLRIGGGGYSLNPFGGVLSAIKTPTVTEFTAYGIRFLPESVLKKPGFEQIGGYAEKVGSTGDVYYSKRAMLGQGVLERQTFTAPETVVMRTRTVQKGELVTESGTKETEANILTGQKFQYVPQSYFGALTKVEFYTKIKGRVVAIRTAELLKEGEVGRANPKGLRVVDEKFTNKTTAESSIVGSRIVETPYRFPTIKGSSISSGGSSVASVSYTVPGASSSSSSVSRGSSSVTVLSSSSSVPSSTLSTSSTSYPSSSVSGASSSSSSVSRGFSSISSVSSSSSSSSISRSYTNRYFQSISEKVRPIDREKYKSRKGQSLFNVEARRRGRFEKLNTSPVSLKEAFSIGQKAVDTSARASFRILPVRGVGGSEIQTAAARYLPGTRYRLSKKDRSIFVERRRFRISTPGEKAEIRPKKSIWRIK